MAAGRAGRQDLLTVRLLGDSVSRVVWLEGEVDLSTVALLVEALDVAIAERPEVLLIDLRNLTFLDSTGLRSLLVAQEACRAIDCRLLLTRGSRPVERLIAGVDGLFEFVSGPSEWPVTSELKTHGGYAFVQRARELAKAVSHNPSGRSPSRVFCVDATRTNRRSRGAPSASSRRFGGVWSW
jgi:anti-anti-sigma factor